MGWTSVKKLMWPQCPWVYRRGAVSRLPHLQFLSLLNCILIVHFSYAPTWKKICYLLGSHGWKAMAGDGEICLKTFKILVSKLHSVAMGIQYVLMSYLITDTHKRNPEASVQHTYYLFITTRSIDKVQRFRDVNGTIRLVWIVFHQWEHW